MLTENYLFELYPPLYTFVAIQVLWLVRIYTYIYIYIYIMPGVCCVYHSLG